MLDFLSSTSSSSSTVITSPYPHHLPPKRRRASSSLMSHVLVSPDNREDRYPFRKCISPCSTWVNLPHHQQENAWRCADCYFVYSRQVTYKVERFFFVLTHDVLAFNEQQPRILLSLVDRLASCTTYDIKRIDTTALARSPK